MKLKLRYETQEEIPDGFDTLYEEKDGAWVLTGIEGMQTEENVTRLEEALRKEKLDHKAVKTKLRAFDGIDPETVHDEADELKDLRAQKEAGELNGQTDDEKIEAMVESRLARATAPLERDLKTAKEERDAAVGENDGLKGEIVSGRIQTAIRKAAEKAKVAISAVEDVVALGERLFEIEEDGGAIVTRDGVGVTPSITADLWLEAVKESKPHWWPSSTGGGATGNEGGGTGAKNPWSTTHWNATDQAAVIKKEGLPRAEQMAKAAGSKVGATRPPEKKAA